MIDLRRVIVNKRSKNNNAVPSTSTGAKGSQAIESEKETVMPFVERSPLDDGIVTFVDDSEFADVNDGLGNNGMGDENEFESSDGGLDSPRAPDNDEDSDDEIILGGTATTEPVVGTNNSKGELEKATQLLAEHPELKHLFNKFLDDRIEDVKKMGESGKTSQKEMGEVNTPIDKNQTRTKTIKSPSDTTLYKPVYNRIEFSKRTNYSE